MTITAEILADSINPDGKRMTTVQVRYPRMIHSENMTHKMISKSASSSRATPVKRLIRDILEDPAEPVSWGANQKGMQAGQELAGWRLWLTKRAWHSAKHFAVLCARVANAAGVHKQVVNRILEPWSHISVVMSATDWANFFALRCHHMADPTMRALADAIHVEMGDSTPRQMGWGEWHLPYITNQDVGDLPKISAARCARVSYLNHDRVIPSPAEDIQLWDRLMASAPVHASPAEHQAVAHRPALSSGNLRGGWLQHRHMYPNESVPG